MFKILNDEQLPILQIVPLIFIWDLNWLDIWVEYHWLHRLTFWITKVALLLRVLKILQQPAKCTVREHVDISIPQCTAMSGKVLHWDRNHALGVLAIGCNYVVSVSKESKLSYVGYSHIHYYEGCHRCSQYRYMQNIDAYILLHCK